MFVGLAPTGGQQATLYVLSRALNDAVRSGRHSLDSRMTPRAIRHRIERIDVDMARVLAGTSEVARLQAAFRMWTAARSVLRAAIAADHADWNPDRIEREAADRLGHGLVSRVSS